MTFGKLIGVFLLAAAAMNILFLTWFPIEDNDIWWLPAAGREMVQSGGILKSDVWSCTINGQSWLNKYIPFEILVYMLYAKGGANALIALRSFFALLSAAAMFGIAALWGRRENSPALNIPLAASLLTLTGLLAAPRMFVRPELCSLVCFAIAVCLWENQRGKNVQIPGKHLPDPGDRPAIPSGSSASVHAAEPLPKSGGLFGCLFTGSPDRADPLLYRTSFGDGCAGVGCSSGRGPHIRHPRCGQSRRLHERDSWWAWRARN